MNSVLKRYCICWRFSGPISALGTPARKHIQRKPMVKMPSKDSGTGNSVESSRSNGSKDEDYLIHGDEASFGSSVLDKGFKKDVNKPMLFRKPLVKQESTGIASMVSGTCSSIAIFLLNRLYTIKLVVSSNSKVDKT